MKALALFSGGLDSAIAIKLIQEQGIEIEAVYVDIGFESNKNKHEELKKLANELDVKLTIFDIRDDYIKNILFTPKYGYGKNMNPCIDCHANMIKVAKNYLNESNAKFIISGEVVNQRPMSQTIPSMNAVNKLSNSANIVLRPLSAKLLPPTIPELEGWVNRDKLLAISGRDRKIQLSLAKKYNLENFESPSGGCLLTDINFSKRLKDFSKHLNLTKEEIDILKVGRHFKINNYKIIISRNKEENHILKEYKGNLFIKLFPKNFKGPVGLLQKEAPFEIKKIAADMIVSYSKEEKKEVIVGEEIIIGENQDKSKFSNYLI